MRSGMDLNGLQQCLYFVFMIFRKFCVRFSNRAVRFVRILSTSEPFSIHREHFLQSAILSLYGSEASILLLDSISFQFYIHFLGLWVSMLPWLLLLLLFLFHILFRLFLLFSTVWCVLFEVCVFLILVLFVVVVFFTYIPHFLSGYRPISVSLPPARTPSRTLPNVRLSSADSFGNLNECHTRFLKKWETEISYKNWIAYMNHQRPYKQQPQRLRYKKSYLLYLTTLRPVPYSQFWLFYDKNVENLLSSLSFLLLPVVVPLYSPIR